MARGLAEGGQLGEAFACEERLRVLAPNDPAGFGLSAQTCLAGGDAACCEAMAAHALSLARGSSADGAALARLRVLAGNCAVAAARWGDAEAHYAAAAAEGAAGGGLGGEELAGALNNLGNVRRMQRDWTGAAAAYRAAARAAPGFADAHFNAGGAILEAGGAADPAKAVAPLATALALDPASLGNWRALAGALERTGAAADRAAAARLLRGVVRIGDARRAARDAVDLAGAAARAGRPREARDALARAIRLLRAVGSGSARRAAAAGSGVPGGGAREGDEGGGVVGAAAAAATELAARGGAAGGAAAHSALSALQALPELSPREVQALGVALAGNELRDYDAGAELLAAAAARGAPGALPAALYALQTTCQWARVSALLPRLPAPRAHAGAVAGAEGDAEGQGESTSGGVSPYEALYLGLDPAALRAWAVDAARPLNREAARALAGEARGAADSPARWWAAVGEEPRWVAALGAGGAGAQVRVGYLTSDMKLSHPIGQLLVPLLEGHDRARFAPVCLDAHAVGLARSPGAYRAEVQALCGEVHSLAALAARAAAARMNALGLHVVVNLNGWSGEDRNDALALRPAPLAVNALGFPGTAGCAFVHALLADRVAAPPEHAAAFAERLLLLPPSHHPLPQRALFGAFPPPPRAGGGTSRASAGLPEEGEGVVLASFNRCKKLDAATWAAWLGVLRAAPRAVLWLSRIALSPAAERRLLASAAAAGVEPRRVVLTDTFPASDHLRVKSLADIFLDTPAYNAHVTAGCPPRPCRAPRAARRGLTAPRPPRRRAAGRRADGGPPARFARRARLGLLRLRARGARGAARRAAPGDPCRPDAPRVLSAGAGARAPRARACARACRAARSARVVGCV